MTYYQKKTTVEVEPGAMDVKGAARYLSVSVPTIHRLVRKGELPHVRIGRSVRFSRADLEAYLAERSTTKFKAWTEKKG